MNENRYGTILSPVLDEATLNNPELATGQVFFIYFFYQDRRLSINLYTFQTYMYTTKVDIPFRTMKIKGISIASNETQNVRKDTIQKSTDLHSDRQQKLVFQYTSARLHYSQISNQIILVLIKSFEKSMETFWRMVNADAKAPSSRFIRRRQLTIDTSVR